MKQQHKPPGSSRRISCQRLQRTARRVRVMKYALGEVAAVSAATGPGGGPSWFPVTRRCALRAPRARDQQPLRVSAVQQVVGALPCPELDHALRADDAVNGVLSR